jgi:putative transposase
MQKFKSPGSAEKFLNIQSATYNTFYFQRHLLKRAAYKGCRAEALDVWENAGVAA